MMKTSRARSYELQDTYSEKDNIRNKIVGDDTPENLQCSCISSINIR